MGLGNIFLEEEDKSPPFPLDWAIWIRRGVAAVLLLATFCVLLVSLFQAKTARFEVANLIVELLSDVIDFFGYKLTAASPDLLFLVIAVILTAVQLGYLYLVLGLLIFSSSPNRIYWQKAIIPLFLIVAYGADFGNELVFNLGNVFASIYSTDWDYHLWVLKSERLKKASYFFFILVYIYWLGRDWVEKGRNPDPSRQYEIKRWMMAESLILLALMLRFGHELKCYSLGKWLKFGSDKSIVIAICVFLWAFLNVFFRDLKKIDYKDIYTNYLEKNHPRLLSQPISLIDWNKVALVLDFGCANGQRLCDTLPYLNFDSTRSITIKGYDENVSWRDSFSRLTASKNYKCEFVMTFNKRDLSIPTFVFISHVLYDLGAVKKVVRFLKKCKSETYVVIRGVGPRSFFNVVNEAYSVRVIDPTKSHYWNTEYLKKVERKANLVRIDDTKTIDAPDLIVKQDYYIDDDGIRYAKNLLNYLYNRPTGDNAAEYFKSLRVSGVTSVPNDDLIYIYRIHRTVRTIERVLGKCSELIKKTLRIRA